MAVGSSLISQVKSWVLPPTIIELLELCLAAFGSTVEHVAAGGLLGVIGSGLADTIGSVTALLCGPKTMRQQQQQHQHRRETCLAKGAGFAQ
jgi:hypothetical protein